MTFFCGGFANILLTFYGTLHLLSPDNNLYVDFMLPIHHTFFFTKINYREHVGIFQTFYAVILTRFLQRKYGDFMGFFC